MPGPGGHDGRSPGRTGLRSRCVAGGIAGGGWIRDPQLPTRPAGGCRWHSASSAPSSTWSSTTQPPRQSRSHGERHELGIRSRALQLLILGGPHRRGRRHVRHTGAPLLPPACLRPLLPVRDSRIRPPGCLRPGSPRPTGSQGRSAAQAAAFSRMWIPHAEPRPMTCVMPTLAPSIWRSPASPRRCVVTS